MEKQIFHYFLIIHVICGILSLLTGTVAMSVKKGGKTHNRAGIIFYWAMFGVFITTIIFLIIYPTNLKYQFFLTIGIVSFYPAFAGKRALGMKKGINPNTVDWTAAWAVGICGVAMWIYAIYGFMNPQNFRGLAVLFFIFGTLCLQNSYSDLKGFFSKAETPKMHWFFSHGTKMTGSFAAAVTAFFVNVVPRAFPESTPYFVFLLMWIAPGVIIGVIGGRILVAYRRKFIPFRVIYL
jgi:hypothetical protein